MPAVQKRKTLEAQTSSKKRKNDDYTEASIFTKMAREAGLQLMNGGSANILCHDQSTFQKNFLKKIRYDDADPSRIEDLLNGFECYISHRCRFIRAMMTTEMAGVSGEGSDNAVQRSVQDSVVRLMLKTPPVQTRVAEILIQKLEDHKDKENVMMNDECHSLGNENETINVPQLIVNQLRWLDILENSRSITEKLLDAAKSMSHQTACGIITSLPEIIQDDIHDEVATKLKELLESNQELTIVILDTLSSMNCSDESIESVKRTVFGCMRTIKLEELPVIVKYLLQTVNQSNASSSLSCLRMHLTFAPEDLSQCSQSSSKARKSQIENTSVRLTAEAILSAMQYKSVVADSWMKMLKNLNEEEFTSTDFVSLVLLCSNFNAAHKKAATALMKNKTLSNIINESLLHAAFSSCSHVLTSYFGTLSDLASNFLSSASSTLRHIGSALCICMFSELDGYCKQEIIGNLVQHVGSSCSSEVDTALETLNEISIKHFALLTPFCLFVKGILDHLERLSSHQIRLLYEVLSRLAFSQCDSKSAAIQDEIHMIIRKQLTHTTLKYNYIGVIGSVCILSIIESNTDSGENSKTASSVLKLLEDTTTSNNTLRAFYLDELESIFHHVDSKLGKRLNKIFLAEFRVKFVCADDLNSTGLESSTDVMFEIVENPHNSIPIFPVVCLSDCRSGLLCSLMRAITGTSENPSSSSEFLDLASSPVVLHVATTVKSFTTVGHIEQKQIMDSLFLALNWFRELLNVFARCGLGGDNCKYALARIKHIIKVSETIDLLGPVVHKYLPDQVILDFNKPVPRMNITADAVNVTQNDPGTSRNISSNSTQTQKNNGNSKPGSKSKKKSEPCVSVQSMGAQYFRELDIGVFHILKTQMGETLFHKTDNGNADEQPDAQLFPDQLLFLLQDLKKKLHHKLLTCDTDKKAFPFGGTSTHVGFEKLNRLTEQQFGERVSKLIQHLCNHLESIHNVFQPDSALPVEDLEIEERFLLINCFEDILEVLNYMFSWRNVAKEEKHFRKVFVILGHRLSPEIDEDTSRSELLKSSFLYLRNFGSIVTTVSLKSAESLSKLLSTVVELGNDDKMKNDLFEFTSFLLKYKWPSTCRNASAVSHSKPNDILASLLRLNLKYSADVLKSVGYFVDEGLCKIGKEDGECAFPSFVKSNAHVMFGCLLGALATESFKIPAIRTSDSESAQIALLLNWNDCMKIAGVLIRLLRDFHSRMNIISSLKYSRILIDNFIKSGMPICEKLFSHYQDDIVSLLKHLQVSTRQLQHLTCHSKVLKDVSLCKQVPPLKRSMESLLFRVKGMLALHNCQEAFWLGNLKNRNIQGDEILSQVMENRGCGDDMEDSNADAEMSYSESY